MSILVGPRSRVLSEILKSPDFSGVFIFLLLTGVLALTLGTSGCSSLNAGGATASAQSGPTQKIIVSPSLPDATVGSSYSATVSVTGGTAPYRFTPVPGQGNLPVGLKIDPLTGVIFGSAKASGTYPFMLFVTDHLGRSGARQKMALTVVKAPVVTALAVDPAQVTLSPGQKYQFTAVATDGSSPAVNWAVSAGTISATGLYTAPPANSDATVTVTASSQTA